MNRRHLMSMALGWVAFSVLPAAPARAARTLPLVEVFKSPHCACCGAWVEHMKAAGFQVKVTLVDDTSVARKRARMPDSLASCHTAFVGGYALEGHVPAEDVKRLLQAKPAAIGLAVPGMPAGSPGMEVGARKDPYDVLLVAPGGRATVFASHPKS